MVIFFYMLVLLAPGIAYRGWQVATGQYLSQGAAFVAEDLISLAMVCFGLIGLWGYARKRGIFSQGLWQAYFVLMALLIALAPFVSPKYSQLAANEGVATMSLAYLISLILVSPAMWGWYSYAFRRPTYWAPASSRMA